MLPYDGRWEFPSERLKLGPELGSGAFGRVVRAEVDVDDDFQIDQVSGSCLAEALAKSASIRNSRSSRKTRVTHLSSPGSTYLSRSGKFLILIFFSA